MAAARARGRQAEVAPEAHVRDLGPGQRTTSGCTGRLQHKWQRDLRIQVDKILVITGSDQLVWQLRSTLEEQCHAGGGHRPRAVLRLHTVVARLRTLRPRQLH